MSERYDLPKIKPKEEPTVFNHEAAKWGFISSIVAPIVGVIIGTAHVLKKIPKISDTTEKEIDLLVTSKSIRNISFAVVATTVLATIMGGVAGKKKQEREQIEGRVVKNPGFWNEGVISGMFLTDLGVMAVNLISGKPRIGFGKQLAINAAGAVAGGIIRNNEMEREYNEAIALRKTAHHAILAGQAAQPMLVQTTGGTMVLAAPQPPTTIQAATANHASVVATAPVQQEATV